MKIDVNIYHELLGWAKGKLCFKGKNTHLEPSDLINEAIIKCYEENIDLSIGNIKLISKNIISNEIGRISRIVSYDSLKSEKYEIIKPQNKGNQDLTCRKCKIPKPTNCFSESIHKNGFIQTHSYCKDCEREISKICERNKRKRQADEEGRNIRPRRRSVLAKDETGIIIHSFNQIKDAMLLGYKSSSITLCCQGRMKKYKGLVWNYT